jgi:hypothetical protein
VYNPESFSIEFVITMIVIMEPLKHRRFFTKVFKALKELGLKERLIIDIVESFDDALSPRFCLGHEYGFDTHIEAELDDFAKGPRVSV